MTEVVLDAGIRGVDPAHSAVQGAWAELRQDLREVHGLRVEERAVAGEGTSKGLESELITLITALTTTATITGFVNVLKLWLGRDRRRTLKVTVRDTGKETVYDISGENISVDALRDAVKAAVQPRRKR
jgi:hypothetical protein